MLVCFLMTPVSYSNSESVPEKSSEKIAKKKKTSRKKKKNRKKVKNKSPLPTLNKLIEDKISNLASQISEQSSKIENLEKEIETEKKLQDEFFDSDAYLNLRVVNKAPQAYYKLESSKIYLDGKLITQGRKSYENLPGLDPLYNGPISQGCHVLSVELQYTRLKNDLITRFLGVERNIVIVKEQHFVAKSGYVVGLEAEGFEQQNSLLSFYRGPALRFNGWAKPVFVKNAPIASLNSVISQGRLNITFINEDAQNYELESKSLSIDGMPILKDVEHENSSGNIIFDSSIREGKHTLNVELIFTEKKSVRGGPTYKLKLDFNRVFYVLSGQITYLELVTLPKEGLARDPSQNVFATAKSKVASSLDPEFFPSSCFELTQESSEETKEEAEVKHEENLAPVIPEEPNKENKEEQPNLENKTQENPGAPETHEDNSDTSTNDAKKTEDKNEVL